MSKVALSGNASGTGTFTIKSPNSNTDRTLSLPDSTGTVLNDQSNIEAQVKTATNATGSAPIYSCRAWCNFNGTGTVAIRASGNVSSITDNGVGNYLVNLATAMPDANFSTTGVSGNAIVNPGDYHMAATNPSSSTIDIRVFTTGTVAQDPAQCCIAIFR